MGWHHYDLFLKFFNFYLIKSHPFMCSGEILYGLQYKRNHLNTYSAFNIKRFTNRLRQILKKGMGIKMKKATKTKQIVVRFDNDSYEKISVFAETEHRGLGEFVRHAALDYIERLEKAKALTEQKEGAR